MATGSAHRVRNTSSQRRFGVAAARKGWSQDQRGNGADSAANDGVKTGVPLYAEQRNAGQRAREKVGTKVGRTRLTTTKNGKARERPSAWNVKR